MCGSTSTVKNITLTKETVEQNKTRGNETSRCVSVSFPPRCSIPFPPCCSPLPPCERLLVAVVRGAVVAVVVVVAVAGCWVSCGCGTPLTLVLVLVWGQVLSFFVSFSVLALGAGVGVAIAVDAVAAGICHHR